MTDDLDALKNKLDAAMSAATPDTSTAPHGRMLGDAMRLAIDLVISVVIGGAMGWALDRALGTKPWFILIFLIFGVAAGFRNFYVFAGKLLRPDQPPTDTP